MNKKFIALFLIAILLFTSMNGVYSDEDRDYSIDSAIVNLIINENGLVHVNETYHYSFKGVYNGVYRDIPLKEGESIENIEVFVKGAYADYYVSNQSDVKKIIIYLYSDPEKTQKLSSDAQVDVNIAYDMENVITLYNDIGQLHFKLIGEEWEKDIGHVKSTIQFKSSDGVKYWINPYYANVKAEWSKNSLLINSEAVKSGDYLEIRALIPKNQFKNPAYVKKVDKDGMAEIEKIQNDYRESMELTNNVYLIVAIILFLSILIPFYAYFRYGREPKIAYSALYEREPPTNDSPAFVSCISGKSHVGEPSMDTFQSTIMDLINRKYLSINTEESSDDSVVLIVNEDKLFNLERYEKEVINILKIFKQGFEISFKYMQDVLSSEIEIAKTFTEKFDQWKKDYKENYFGGDKLNRFFISKGSHITNRYGILAIIISLIIIIFSFFNMEFMFLSITPNFEIFSLASIILLIVGIISIIMPYKVFGRWTVEGREFDAKWKNFKKYLNDFSLIKEHPPESIAIWNEYLVYATALGVADNVKKAMEMNLTSFDLDNNDIYIYHHYGAYSALSSSYFMAYSTANPSSDGGNGGGFDGGAGGGSGGGGGGAF